MRSESRPLTVLYSVPAPSATSNPYTTMLADYVSRRGVRVQFFSWWTALTGRYDVLHVHWPETMVRHPHRLHALARLVAGHLLLLRLSASRISVVQTVHNTRPHESGSRLEARFISLLRRRTNAMVHINPVGGGGTTHDSVILHGDYWNWYSPLLPGALSKTRGAFLLPGALRPYKGAEDLIAAFYALSDKRATLTIAGAPITAEYGVAIRELAQSDSRVSLKLERLADLDFALEVLTSSVVVLPYREMFNSGVALLALSLGTHVLAPRTEVNSALQAEFGEEWISLYDGDLTAEQLAEANEKSAAIAPNSRPDMSQRDWEAGAAAHTDLYVSLQPHNAKHHGGIGPSLPVE